MSRINGSDPHVKGRQKSLVRAALAAALLIPGFASNALAAGTVSGQITNSVTHTGIPGAKVQFIDFSDGDGDFGFTATADANGNYSQNLPDGTYAAVTHNTQGYINKIWNNISCSATCDVDSITPVVVAGGAITGINFALTPGGGRIAGTITSSATGSPIAGALVFFIDGGGNFPFSTATTDSLGHYLSDGGTDTGNVFVITATGQGYQDESYNNHKCTIETCDAADPVAVTLGATTSGINFALDPGGRISGTVRDVNNSPLVTVNVQVHDSTGEQIDEVLTDASGNFITSGLPSGTYYVGTDNSLGLVDYLWNGLLCVGGFCDQTQGTPISVTVPSTTSGINFVLTPGKAISGTVTAAAGGAPLDDVFINLVNSSGGFVGGAITDATGAFTTGAVPPGTYFANTFANGYVQQLYNHISCTTGCPTTNGTPIVVTNQPVTNINFSLLTTGTTGSITGTVTDVVGGTLPTGLQVQLLTPSGGVVSTTNTTSGVYTFNNVASGSYYVRTNASGLLPNGTALINQLYNGVTCVSCSVLTTGGSTLVTVSSGVTTSGINFNLQRGAVITGTITAAVTNSPLSGIGAQVFNSAGVSVGTYNSNASGVFTTFGLPAGTYYVRTTNNVGYVNQLWQGQLCPQTFCIATSGTPVVVSGATVSGINFALTIGGRISGNVTDASNSQPLSFAPVAVFSSGGLNLGSVNTDASGNYTTSGLPPGTYFVRTATGPLFVNNQQLAFVDQLWSGTQCVPACLNATVGTPVTVTSGATTSNVNFALSRGGSISGAVIDAGTGNGLSVNVQIYTSAGVFAKAAGTNAAGGYTVAGLPPGTYYARTSVFSGLFYQDALYNGMSCSSGCSVTTGTPITVLAGAVSTGVNFALLSGAGGISGTITDVRTGAPLPGVSVQIYTASGVFTKTAITNFAGAYATSGLAPGTYFARTLHENVPSLHANQLYSGIRCSNCTVTNGTPIVVAAGAMTTGIDFALGSLLTKGDFDADGKTDIAVYRPSTGVWYILKSSTNFTGSTGGQWGASTDVPVPGDYDGDGTTDVAVYRPSTGVWYILKSSTNFTGSTGAQWGASTDVPVPGDYDGDGTTDVAVYRPSTGVWYILKSSTNFTGSTGAQWGASTDVPVPGDYDGDGTTDVAVYRPSTGVWYILKSSTNFTGSTGAQWGASTDVPVPGDYDGDGTTDVAVYRPSTGVWYILKSSTNFTGSTGAQWGASTDVPVPGDYDGDGTTDVAVYRPSTGVWYILKSSTNFTGSTGAQWGASTDVPVINP